MSASIVISGCCGRMGKAIALCALRDCAFTIGAALEASGHAAIGQDYGTFLGKAGAAAGLKVSGDAKDAIKRGDVVIEFTTPDTSVEHANLASQFGKAIVVGTTGLSREQIDALKTASKKIPVLVSPNMSLGVNLLFELSKLAAERFGHSFDVEVSERHHKHKKDAPSGTAKHLARILAQARGVRSEDIPVHAVREGDIIGDHSVVFSSSSERIELIHRAQSREVFANGALRAAQFVLGQRPGFYDMSNVLVSAGQG